MERNAIAAGIFASVLLASCNSSNDLGVDPRYPLHRCGDADITSTHCVEIDQGDANGLLTAANSLSADTTIVLAVGTYGMTNELNIQSTSGVHILGQGIDVTVLDFDPTTTQVNGIAASGTDGFLVQDFTVANSPKDGIRVEASDRVTFRRIKATWANPALSTNGAYGIYPVKSRHVLVEESVAENASDAGLYVGQCQYVIVRNNLVYWNVAGLEIENTQYADVYGNDVHDNTGGLVVFDLPGNPIVGRDIRIHDNLIRNNNGPNFAMAGSTVASIPSGTGTFAMASRRVEILNNQYQGNNTVDIGLVSGLVIQADQSLWTLDPTSPAFVGDYLDLGLLPGFTKDTATPPNFTPDATKISNFRLENIVIAGNSHMGSGTDPDLANPLQIGILLMSIYGGTLAGSVMPARPVDSVVYDTVGETDLTTNDNHICAGGNVMGSFASLDFASQIQSFPPTLSPYVTFLTPPFGPSDGAQFDCTTLNGPALVVWDGN